MESQARRDEKTRARVAMYVFFFHQLYMMFFVCTCIHYSNSNNLAQFVLSGCPITI